MKKIILPLLIIGILISFNMNAYPDDNPFPNIATKYRGDFALNIIKDHISKFKLGQIKNNQIRLFIQPWGIVSNVYVIDLESKSVTIYPGTHEKLDPEIILLDDKLLNNLTALLIADNFKNIASENTKLGYDGTSHLLETKINNIYSYKLHWETDNQYFKTIIEQICSLKPGSQ